MTLETSRLVFRELSEAHTQELFEMDNDVEVMRFINGGRPTPWDGFQNRVRTWTASLYEQDPKRTFWAAHRALDDVFVGWFHLRLNPRFGNRLELGYRLRREHWNQGYATEGSRALLERGFGELGAAEIIAVTLERNTRSRRVMEKLGMEVEEFFIYPEDLLPFWTEQERRAVLYSRKP
jgi:RimJ/RimL family protein N-acetyltransferase